MNKTLDKMLCDRFPMLYADRHASSRTTAMCWGFSCGDGWFPIIFKLSEEIEAILKRLGAEAGFTEATKTTKVPYTPPEEHFRVMQVKEKFGTLRFYTNTVNDEISAVISRAEHLSASTCEECGEPGVLRGKSWVRTTCAGCSKGSPPRDCDITLKCEKHGTPGCTIDHAAVEAEEAALEASEAQIDEAIDVLRVTGGMDEG